jgi:transposase
MESEPQKREEYLSQIEGIAADMLVYVDESGIEISMQKERGWSKIGEKLLGQISGKFYKRLNVIAGIVNNKPIAPYKYEGSCNTELFVEWVKLLAKELIAGQTVVMDNAAFHKSPKVREIIESVGCNLIYLPPYSPDLNPIEKFWANMKNWIKQKITDIKEIHYLLSEFFKSPNTT